jgi:terminase small subunit / prophage DNA-packing protein
MALKPPEGALNQENSALSCGVSLATFRRWNVQPVCRIGRELFYMGGDILANRMAAEERRRATRSETDRDERIAKVRLTRAQADHAELRNDEARRTHAPTDLIRWAIQQAGAGIAGHLERIPAACKRARPKLTQTDLATIRREVTKAQRVAASMQFDMDEYGE